MSPSVAELKVAHRGVWASGDYAAVAELIDDAPPRALIERVDIKPGQDVIDVATGTGNAALLAAAAGAQVVGLDLAPELFGTAQARAERAGVVVDWVEGDCEALPYDDASFDHVLSIFGVQFAPRHAVTTGELVRVCRPAGTIGLVNWTPAGHIGEILKTIGSHMPALPDYASPPPLWGNEQHVRELFEPYGVECEFAVGHNPWRFDSAEHFVSFFETVYGPMLKARERLSATGDWEACREQLVALCERRNEATDGSLLVPSEFLVAIIRKPA